MPLGRKHLRRNRDAPIGTKQVEVRAGDPAWGSEKWPVQRTASNLSRTRREVNVPKDIDAAAPGWEAGDFQQNCRV
jgi:hypothetical protein